MDSDFPEKPKFFAVIGWSWLIFGATGSFFGLLSLPALFQVDELRNLLGSQAGMESLPGFGNLLDRIFGLLVPVTIIQLILSFLTVWTGWEFLKRQNWARLGLSAINLITIIGIIWAGQVMWFSFQSIAESLSLQSLIEQGMMQDIPSMVSMFLILSTIAMIAPLLWLSWYLHSEKVKNYFTPDR